jgi:hypothetical protein
MYRMQGAEFSPQISGRLHLALPNQYYSLWKTRRDVSARDQPMIRLGGVNLDEKLVFHKIPIDTVRYPSLFARYSFILG